MNTYRNYYMSTPDRCVAIQWPLFHYYRSHDWLTPEYIYMFVLFNTTLHYWSKPQTFVADCKSTLDGNARADGIGLQLRQYFKRLTSPVDMVSSINVLGWFNASLPQEAKEPGRQTHITICMQHLITPPLRTQNSWSKSRFAPLSFRSTAGWVLYHRLGPPRRWRQRKKSY